MYNTANFNSLHDPELRYRANDPKKLILHLHLKSLERDNVYKLCL